MAEIKVSSRAWAVGDKLRHDGRIWDVIEVDLKDTYRPVYVALEGVTDPDYDDAFWLYRDDEVSLVSSPAFTDESGIKHDTGKDPFTDESGIKHDTGKDPWHLAPFDAIRCILLVLAFGAQKYAPRNWEKGMAWSRLFAATQRHLTAWWQKEGTDSDTGYSHLWHAGCCVLFLIAYELRGKGEDDRP